MPGFKNNPITHPKAHYALANLSEKKSIEVKDKTDEKEEKIDIGSKISKERAKTNNPNLGKNEINNNENFDNEIDLNIGNNVKTISKNKVTICQDTKFFREHLPKLKKNNELEKLNDGMMHYSSVILRSCDKKIEPENNNLKKNPNCYYMRISHESYDILSQYNFKMNFVEKKSNSYIIKVDKEYYNKKCKEAVGSIRKRVHELKDPELNKLVDELMFIDKLRTHGRMNDFITILMPWDLDKFAGDSFEHYGINKHEVVKTQNRKKSLYEVRMDKNESREFRRKINYAFLKLGKIVNQVRMLLVEFGHISPPPRSSNNDLQDPNQPVFDIWSTGATLGLSHIREEKHAG